MKKLLFLSTLLLSISLLKSQEMTKEQQVSYIIGYNIGSSLKQSGDFKFDVDAIVKAMKAALAGEKSDISDADAQYIMQEWQMEMQAKEEAKAATTSSEEKANGIAFLEENKHKNGVVVTPSGLQYKVEVMGKGPKPKATDKVKVHYEGTLIDGTVFDSSYKRGEPISFPLNGVIKGWTEGVQLMPVGSKFTFYIPSELGYGDRGAGAQIKGGATLIFVVELLGIE
jgi:FKBP-type peptidyl-prolyl cis-trans isomerase